MPRYVYTGIQTAIALPGEKEGDPPVDVALIPYEEVELPDGMPYVQRLVGKGLLTEVQVVSATAPEKPKKVEAIDR